MTIYHNPRCSKSRQTLGLIHEKDQDVTVREYLKDVPSKEELTWIIEKLGIAPLALVRKGEADFKENFKGKNLTDEQWVEAMIEYPKLIERPIVIKGEKVILGRPPENVLDIL